MDAEPSLWLPRTPSAGGATSGFGYALFSLLDERSKKKWMPHLHRGYLGLPLRGAPRQRLATHYFCFLMNAQKKMVAAPSPWLPRSPSAGGATSGFGYALFLLLDERSQKNGHYHSNQLMREAALDIPQPHLAPINENCRQRT